VTQPRPRKPYVQRERRYIAECIEKYFPHDLVFYNLRIGPAPIGIAEAYPGLDVDRYARVWKKFADAVSVGETEVRLCEAKLRTVLEAVGKLIAYADRIWETPEITPYIGRKLRKIIFAPVVDPTLDLLLKEHGIELIVERPKWADEYLKEVNR